MTKSQKDINITFEEAMEKLDQIVKQLENGDSTLEESMQLFSQGMELSKTSNEIIDSIEHRITLLIKDTNEKPCEIEFEE